MAIAVVEVDLAIVDSVVVNFDYFETVVYWVVVEAVQPVVTAGVVEVVAEPVYFERFENFVVVEFVVIAVAVAKFVYFEYFVAVGVVDFVEILAFAVLDLFFHHFAP